MKLLLLGAFGPGALENYYLRGFRLLGINCDVFDITDHYYQAIGKSFVNKVINKLQPNFFFNEINSGLLNWIKGRGYDVIIVFKGHTLYPSTLAALKEFAPKICCYNPDHPFIYYAPGSGNKNVLDSIGAYDLYITYSINIAKAVKEKFLVSTAVIPFGFDDDAQVGASPPIGIAGNFLFAGAYDSERSKLLEALQINNLVIYGDEKWGYRTKRWSRTRNCYAQKPLYGQSYIDAIAAATGVFNFLRTQNIRENSHNMRTFEVPGYGGLMISERTNEQESFFEDNKEAIYFDSIAELNDKLRYIDKNPAFVEKIKQNAFLKCRRAGFGYNQRAREWKVLLETLIG